MAGSTRRVCQITITTMSRRCSGSAGRSWARTSVSAPARSSTAFSAGVSRPQLPPTERSWRGQRAKRWRRAITLRSRFSTRSVISIRPSGFGPIARGRRRRRYGRGWSAMSGGSITAIQWFGWRSSGCRHPETLPVGGCKRLVEIADQIVGGFETDREADHVGPGPGGRALLVGQLTMCRRRRMQDQAARVADIGEVREQAHALDQLDAGFVAASDAESEDCAGTFWQVFAAEVVKRALLEPSIGNPSDARMIDEELGDPKGIDDMAVHAQMQGLDTGQSQKRVHRRQGRAKIAQCHGARLGGEGKVAEILVEFEPVIRGLWVGQ